MTRVLHRAVNRTYPVAEPGSGIRLRDSTGRNYIDASSGAAVSCLGHGHPDLLAAMHAQLDKLAYAHSSFFTTRPAEELAEQLIARLGGHRTLPKDGAALLCGSVSLGALRIASLITASRLRRCLSAGGRPRAPFLDRLIDVEHVSPCYPIASAAPTRQLRPTDSAWPASSMPKFGSWARKTLPPASPKPSPAPRSVPSRPCQAISKPSARSAIVTGCC